MHHYYFDTTTRGVHIYFQKIALQGGNFANVCINTLWMNSFYTTCCGQTKNILVVRVCSTLTGVISRLRIIFTMSVN
jgi:hypothetical protein